MMNDEKNKYIEIQTNFALQILRQIQEKELQSSILAPPSVSISLAIAYNGANGETAKQIADAIAGGKSIKSINTYFSERFKLLQSNETSDFTLKTVNRLYASKDITILEKFADAAKKIYHGLFSQLDFQKNLEDARKEINGFVASATNNLIKEVIQPRFLTRETRLLVISAMYFLGEWKNPFIPQGPYAKPEKFYVSKDITRNVYMMESDVKINYRYEKAADYQVLGIDYKGGKYSMFILLPKERFGLEKIIQKLDAQTLIKHAKNEEMKFCHVLMPGFSFNQKMDLKKTLYNIGIKNCFNHDADFSNLAPDEKIFIYAAMHQAFIKVNEKGTEMAACVALVSAPCTGGKKLPPTIKFNVDHPFLYFVADKEGNILFIGTVVDNFQENMKTLSMPSKKYNTRSRTAAEAKKTKIDASS